MARIHGVFFGAQGPGIGAWYGNLDTRRKAVLIRDSLVWKLYCSDVVRRL